MWTKDYDELMEISNAERKKGQGQAEMKSLRTNLSELGDDPSFRDSQLEDEVPHEQREEGMLGLI